MGQTLKAVVRGLGWAVASTCLAGVVIWSGACGGDSHENGPSDRLGGEGALLPQLNSFGISEVVEQVQDPIDVLVDFMPWLGPLSQSRFPARAGPYPWHPNKFHEHPDEPRAPPPVVAFRLPATLAMWDFLHILDALYRALPGSSDMWVAVRGVDKAGWLPLPSGPGPTHTEWDLPGRREPSRVFIRIGRDVDGARLFAVEGQGMKYAPLLRPDGVEYSADEVLGALARVRDEASWSSQGISVLVSSDITLEEGLVWLVRIQEITGGRPIALGWARPR